MAKFYVQCGVRSLVVDAMDMQAAAMHMVDLAMQPHLWIYDDQDLTNGQRHDHVMLEALLHMAPEIRVSEQGLDRLDAVVHGTPEILQVWHQTMSAVGKLFTAAGLAPRPICQVARVPKAEQREATKKERRKRRLAGVVSGAVPLNGDEFALPLKPIRKRK